MTKFITCYSVKILLRWRQPSTRYNHSDIFTVYKLQALGLVYCLPFNFVMSSY